MELIDFSDCQKSLLVYGGSAERKNGIIYNGKNYFVKFPGSTSKMQNVAISYTNETGLDLKEILLTIEQHDFLKKFYR